MNTVIKFFKERTLSFYLRLAVIVMALVPIFYMCTRLTIETEYVAAVVFGIIAVVAHIAALVFEKQSWVDFLEIVGTLCLAAELGMFAVGGMLSVVDFLYKINFWGDPTQVPAIFGFGAVLAVGMLLSIAVCFLRKAYERKAADAA